MKRIVLFLICVIVAGQAFGQFNRSRGKTGTTPTSGKALNYANPQEYFIGGIEITGLNVLDKNAMISLTGLKIGDKIKIPGDEITGAIRKLWKHGLIGDASIAVSKIEGDNVFLLLQLAERPRLQSFYFTGISKSQETALKEDLSLIRGKIVNDALIRNTELGVKKHFVSKGFLFTEVKVVQESDTGRSDIRLRINVQPKSKVKINKMYFEGNSEVSQTVLKMRMKKTNEHPRITLHRAIIDEAVHVKRNGFFSNTFKTSWEDVKNFMDDNIKLNVFASTKFIKSEYEADKDAVIAYYNSKGYRDAEILTDTFYRYDDKNIDLRFSIHEGPKYYFRDIIWTGNYIHNDRTLNAILGIKRGDIYNNELLQQKITFNPKGPDINGLYMDDGYLFFRVNPIEIAVSGDSIDVEMRIFEGDQATINAVTFTGNDRTSDHVVRRELSTVPGRKFSRTDIIRTQQQLGQLGFFNPQTINPDLKPNPSNGTVDVEWQLEEQSNDQIELSGGWGGFYGFVGTLGLTFNNFSARNIPHFKKWKPLPVGDGQRLSLRMQANGRSFQSYSFSFSEPWLGGRKPQSLSISYSTSIQRQAFDFRDPTNFSSSLKVHSISVGLGNRLEWPDNYFTLTNSLAYLRYELDNWQSGLGFSDGPSNSVTFNATLSRNSIDNPMYPASGSTLSLSATLTPPFSVWNDMDYNDVPNSQKYLWQEYHKWMFDSKFYLPLDSKKKLVIEAKAHFGFIGSYTDKIGIGPFERFFLGGDGLAGGFNSFLLGQEVIGLRGYDNNAITPPNYGQQVGGYNPNLIEGGIVYNKFGLELRYPVTTGNAATIYGFVFTEAGNNWNNYQDFNPFNLYKSAGFGARIFMPAFGLIGLNWAYGFDRLPYSRDISGSQFHFTIGQQLR